MKKHREVLLSMQNIIDKFEGSISFKNSKREYFFVNDHWLNSKNFKKEDVIDKTDDDIFSSEIALFAKESDLKAFEKKEPIEYINKLTINGKEFHYIAFKWIVNFLPEEPLLLITIADFIENKEKVLAFRKDVDAFFVEVRNK